MGRITGTRFSVNTWIHNTIYLKDDVWEMIRYFSSASGRTTSNWLLNTLLDYNGVIREFPKNKFIKGKARSISVPIEKWSEVSKKADKCGMTVSKYISCVIKTIAEENGYTVQ